MTQQAMHGRMGGATAGSEELIPAGAVTFGLVYRTNVGGRDQGVCIHVYGNDIPGPDKELLRFDCFDLNPHYHYRNATIKRNVRLELDSTAEGLPIPWALDKIRNRLPIMLVRCGAEDIARKVDQRDINSVMPKITAWAETMVAQAREANTPPPQPREERPMRPH